MKDARDIWATELVNAAARIAENFHVLETCQAITTLFEANGQTYRLRVCILWDLPEQRLQRAKLQTPLACLLLPGRSHEQT